MRRLRAWCWDRSLETGEWALSCHIAELHIAGAAGLRIVLEEGLHIDLGVELHIGPAVGAGHRIVVVMAGIDLAVGVQGFHSIVAVVGSLAAAEAGHSSHAIVLEGLAVGGTLVGHVGQVEGLRTEGIDQVEALRMVDTLLGVEGTTSQMCRSCTSDAR